MNLTEFYKNWQESLNGNLKKEVIIYTDVGKIYADSFHIPSETKTLEGGYEIVLLFHNKKLIAEIQLSKIRYVSYQWHISESD